MCPLFYLMGFFFFWSLFPHPPSVSWVAESAYLSVHVALIYVQELAYSERMWGLELGAVWPWLSRGSRGAERRASSGTCLVKCALAPCPRQPGGGGGTGRLHSGHSTLLCQQVESVIAVPGEGVRARTPITNHRLPPLGADPELSFWKGSTWILPNFFQVYPWFRDLAFSLWDCLCSW